MNEQIALSKVMRILSRIAGENFLENGLEQKVERAAWRTLAKAEKRERIRTWRMQTRKLSPA